LTDRQLKQLVPQADCLGAGTFSLVFTHQKRGEESTDPRIPRILSPRWTAVRAPRPEILWTRVEDAAVYEIEGAFQERVDAELVACPPAAEWGGARVCSLPWPEGRSGLTAGRNLLIRVTAWTRKGEQRAGTDVGFDLLSPDVLTAVDREAGALEKLGLGEAANQAFTAGLFAQHRLYGDAIQGYRRVLARAPSPAVQVTLGDLYLTVGLPDLARPLYETAQRSEEAVLRAAAAFGLGHVEQEEGAFAAAADRFRTAADLYAEAGLKAEAELARKAEAAARKSAGD
jgi:tetratricopeptide (TPR) repeat protein